MTIWMKTSGVRRPNPRIAKHVLSSCCCFGIQQGLADANARLFVSSPISVNRMCQENAGAEQSHKRSGQFKHGNHLILRADPGGFIKVGVSG